MPKSQRFKWLFIENKNPEKIEDIHNYNPKIFDNEKVKEIVKTAQIHKSMLDIPKLNEINSIDKYIKMYKQLTFSCRAIPFSMGEDSKKITNLINFLYRIYKISESSNKSIIFDEIQIFQKSFDILISTLRKLGIHMKNIESNMKNIDSNELYIEKPQPISLTKETIWNSRMNKQKSFNKEEVEEKKIKKENPLNNSSLETETKQLNNSISYKLNEKEMFDFLLLNNEEKKFKEKKFEEPIIYGRKGDTFSEAKIEEINYLNKNEENVINEVLKLMISSSSPNIIFPEEINNELTQDDFELSYESNLPALILLSKANYLTLKLYQNFVKDECNFKNICVVIGIDCSRTINEKCKVIHSLFIFSLINLLNMMGIPYSIVIFADYKFQYIIKEFNEPHSEEIFQRIYDSITVKRFATKIADVCYFIKKKQFFLEKTKQFSLFQMD